MSEDAVQARITSFWTRIAGDYEAHPGNVPARNSAEYDAWVTAIRDLLPPSPADVLDIATGTGFVALIAAQLGHRVTGIDTSKEMLAEASRQAKREGLPITFAAADAVEPALPAASFDAVISRHFLWTLREPVRAFGNWKRLLRPGGRVVAIDGFWFTSAGEEGDETEGGPDLFQEHYTAETQAALPAMHLTTVTPIVAMFEESGFDYVEVGELAEAYALAADPPGSQPWYTIVARCPA